MNWYTLLLILCLSQPAFSQSKYDSIVQPFEDYSKCYSGFINRLGDTVWPAEFTSVGLDDMLKTPFWWVEKNGKFGVLDQFGRVKLEPIYYNIRIDNYRDDRYFLSLNGKTGVLDLRYNWILPPIYDSISLQMDYYGELMNGEGFYIFSLNGKFGVFDHTLQAIIPPQFDSIAPSCVHYQYTEGMTCYSRFIAKLEGKEIIVDWDGTILLDPLYEKVQPYVLDIRGSNEQFIFHVKNELGQTALLNDKFEMVVPYCDNIYHTQHSWTRQKVCSDPATLNVFAVWEDSVKVYDALDGSHSAAYEKLAQFDDYVLFWKNGSWGVLDSNFRELYSGGKGLPSLNSGHVSTVEWSHRNRILPTNFQLNNWQKYHGFQTCADLGFVWQSELISRDVAHIDYALPRKQNIVCFNTGKSLPRSFDRVFPRFENDSLYFWGIDCSDSSLNITVFNEDAELISEFQNVRFPKARSTAPTELWNTMWHDGSVLLQGENGKMGMLSNSGKLWLDFNYNSVSDVGAYWSEDNQKVQIVQASSDSLTTIIDSRGKVLRSITGRLQLKDYGWLLIEDTAITLFDVSFKVVLENITALGITNNGSYGENLKKIGVYDRDYYVSEGKLYVPHGAEFILVDKKEVPFEDPVYIYRNSILIDKKGNALFAKSSWLYPEVTRFGTGYFAESKDELAYFDEKGTVLNRIEGIEERKTLLRQVIVLFKDGKRGIVDKMTGNWILEPTDRFSMILPMINDDKVLNSYFWGKDSNEEWHLLNRAGEEPFSMAFSTNESWANEHFVIVGREGKYGVIRWDGTVLIPFEIETFRFVKQYLLYRINGEWHAISSQLNQIPAEGQSGFDALEFSPGNLLIAFRNDSVAAYDRHLKPIRTFMPLDEVKNLRVKFDSSAPEQDAEHIKDAAFNQLYNQILFKNLKESSLEIMVREKNQPTNNEPERSVQWSLIGATADRWFTVCKTFRNERVGLRVTQKNEYSQYHLQGDSIVPFEFRELLEEPQKFDQLMDSLLTASIQKQQLYGTVCPNLPEILETMKKQMVFGKHGCTCYESGDKSVLIPWEQLIPFVKKEFQFVLENR